MSAESVLLEDMRSSIVDEAMSSLPVTIPIRIEDPNLRDKEDQDLDIESIIILYNFGIAHLLLSESRRATGDWKLRDRARYFFNVAYSIIASSYEDVKIQPEKLQMEDEKKLILASLVLKNLVSLDLKKGKRSTAKLLYQKLLFYKSAVIERGVCSEKIKFLSPAA